MEAQQARWLVLVALALSALVVGLDLTILNVALPTLAARLGASTGDLQWLVNAYTVTLAAMLLPAGLLGDRLGRKRLLLAALVLFGAASVWCASATSVRTLLVGRLLLGLGAAFILPLCMAVIPVVFRPEERTRAVTIWVTANALSLPLGPILGGWLLDTFWWGSVFLVNVPVVTAALVAVWALLPESRAARPARLAPAAVLTSSAGMAALVFGIIRAGEEGWDDATGLAVAGAGLVALMAFTARQRVSASPLLDLSLFTSREFTGGVAVATAVSAALAGLLFTVPQYLQVVTGADAFGTGLRLLPLIGGMVLGAQVSDRTSRRFPVRVRVAAGAAALAAGLALGATTGADSGYPFVAFWLAAAGIGLGASLPAAMDTALGALPPELAGVGSAALQSLRQVGTAMGVAVLGGVLSSTYRTHLDTGALPAEAADRARRGVVSGAAVAHDLHAPALLESVHTAFLHGMDATVGVAAGMGLVAALLAVALLPRRRGAAAAGPGRSAQSAHDVSARV